MIILIIYEKMVYQRVSKARKWLFLTLTKIISIVLAWIVLIFLHNIAFGIWFIEPPFFFIITFIALPAYFLACVIYTSFCFYKNWKKKRYAKQY